MEHGGCHYCGRTDTFIFAYTGTIIDPSHAEDPELASEHPDIDELCADCINSGNVRKQGATLREIKPLINQFAADKEAATELFHRFPNLPFFQGDTWAICCGDFTEYVGEHPPTKGAYSEYEQWQPQDEVMSRLNLEDFYPLDRLPVMNIMALFHCLHCTRKYWAFQYSGLGWPGPIAGE